MIPSNSVHVLLLQAVSLFSEVSVRQPASLSPESATYGHSCLQGSQEILAGVPHLPWLENQGHGE